MPPQAVCDPPPKGIPIFPRNNWNITAAIASIILLGYIGFLLFANYLSQMQLQEAALDQLKQDMEKRSLAVSYFYYERKNDLRDLQENRSIFSFFHSKALGMSMEYGLQASLYSVSEAFSRILNDKTLDKEKIYKEIAFINTDGQLLSGVSSQESKLKDEHDLSRLLAPELSDATILVDPDKQNQDVLLSIAYYYKQSYQGQIVAWVSAQPVYKHLVKETNSTSRRTIYIVSNYGSLNLPSDVQQTLNQYKVGEIIDLPAGKIYRLKPSSRQGSDEELIMGRVPIKGTPFSLVVLSPAAEIFGITAPWRLPVAMGILSLIVLAGTALAWRINTHNLILRARLEETAKSKQDVEGKNVQLQKEIGERRKAQSALMESEQKYRLLMENTNEGIFIHQDGFIKFPNPHLSTITGYTPQELTSMSFMDLLHPDERTAAMERLLRTLRGDEPSGTHIYRARNKKREQLWFEVNAILHTWEKKTATLHFIRDITPQKNLEAQLLHAHKMEAVGTLAGGIAHDFNNLLQAIQGYSELLLMDQESDGAHHPYLQEIFGAAQRGADLTRQLLTFSRKIESKLRPMDLNQEIVQLRKLLDRTIPKMIGIELHLAGDLHSVNADPAQIEQLLMNLAVNARDAMPSGGKLLICTKNVFLDESYCKSHMGATPGSYVMLQVSDTGHGMDSATLARIFEPFFSSKGIGKGTGLGLSMVYGIVSSHGGYISCESQPGEGTTFEIYLPTIDEAETKDEAETGPVKAMKKGSETILLVDDEDYIRDLGNQILTKFGYSILMAENGQVALDMYRSHWKSIDLVLLDLIMPGISGTECLKELRTINPDVKVVVISGYSPDGSTDELFQLGARGFISKPYQMTQMLQVTREVLDSPTELH
ncbi:response regulator [Desulforhabdus sp. TSK]|uniref:hybrid sensor histidine kinase/response regulator n=1 Tax=Desulforhabdus sp. TSK TaxID=2925014 RepID=UPI001FC8401C|nr:response regulator [Desulforhabdus sp. TSK]GKT06793.1 hybrid sensor histidine kinase/response regulator [Desulforhabdus sp. TSK]